MVSCVRIFSRPEIRIFILHYLLLPAPDDGICSHEATHLHPKIKLNFAPAHSQYLHERSEASRL